MKAIVGKPVLTDPLEASLGARIVKWIHDDNQRALNKKLEQAAAREERARERRRA